MCTNVKYALPVLRCKEHYECRSEALHTVLPYLISRQPCLTRAEPCVVKQTRHGKAWDGMAEVLRYCMIFVWKCPIGQRVCEVRYWPTAVDAACAVKAPALHGHVHLYLVWTCNLQMLAIIPNSLRQLAPRPAYLRTRQVQSTRCRYLARLQDLLRTSALVCSLL